MEDDFYIFEPARNHLIGRRNRRTIRLGDKVEVQIANVNTFKKQVDFRLTQPNRGKLAVRGRERLVPRRKEDGIASTPEHRSSSRRSFSAQRKAIPSSHHVHSGRNKQKRRR